MVENTERTKGWHRKGQKMRKSDKRRNEGQNGT